MVAKANDVTLGGGGTAAAPDPWVTVNNYNGQSAVSWETWQNQLAFARDPDLPRETQARDSKDARQWYDNYVETWNNADADMRNAIDEQHSFALIPPPAAPDAPDAPSGGGSSSSEPPPDLVPDPIDPIISEEPQDENTNDGSDLTPEDNEVIDDELVDLEDPEEERSQDKTENDEDDTILTVRDVTPEDEVVDPLTGQRYATPEEARRAGITNWVWATDYTG